MYIYIYIFEYINIEPETVFVALNIHKLAFMARSPQQCLEKFEPNLPVDLSKFSAGNYPVHRWRDNSGKQNSFLARKTYYNVNTLRLPVSWPAKYFGVVRFTIDETFTPTRIFFIIIFFFIIIIG